MILAIRSMEERCRDPGICPQPQAGTSAKRRRASSLRRRDQVGIEVSGDTYRVAQFQSLDDMLADFDKSERDSSIPSRAAKGFERRNQLMLGPRRCEDEFDECSAERWRRPLTTIITPVNSLRPVAKPTPRPPAKPILLPPRPIHPSKPLPCHTLKTHLRRLHRLLRRRWTPAKKKATFHFETETQPFSPTNPPPTRHPRPPNLQTHLRPALAHPRRWHGHPPPRRAPRPHPSPVPAHGRRRRGAGVPAAVSLAEMAGSAGE